MRYYKLYTDGSHLKGVGASNRLGIGVVLVESDIVLNTESMQVDRLKFKEQYGTDDVSNPTMEMLAVLLGIARFSSILSGNSVEVLADYQGVSEWLNGRWRVNKPYIQKIKDDIMEQLRDNNITAKFTWIKGHAGDKFNEMADRLANPR